MLRTATIIAALALAACATGPTRIETRDVVVTRTERPLTEQQVREVPPPAQLPPRGAMPLRAALDVALAQVCAWVAWGERVDPMLQHSAGMAVTPRVNEPVCRRRE